MLSSLKEKILNVSLFHTGDEIQLPKKKLINVNAGAEILTHFQDQWEDLHKINEDNARKSEKIALEIDKISTYVSDNKKNLGLINHILITSKLSTNIDKCLKNIQELYNTSQTIENDLIQLEDLIEQADFNKLKEEHEYHLTQYRSRKEDSLASFKTELNAKHLKTIEEYEMKKNAVLAERQQVFQDAFKSDLEMYKTSGAIPGRIQQKTQNSALLEEIQLDLDQNELDQFFSDEKSGGS
ncbi:dysbindin protein homolog [Diabrotica virgifera virgifera]|uniref:Dysbindin protein homolog n=1 Tax=Diabrotica virgifera virgifera TaxID=50390 RepID=A0A6P7FDR8_DIAVI|nr:dysbindin protein homolog [Diabrotica virgifera virgifera]